MLLTILNGSSTTDAADWAEEYGIDHPVLANKLAAYLVP